MTTKFVLALLTFVVLVGYFTYYSWSLELVNNSSQIVYYSSNGRLQNLKPLEPQAHMTENHRGFTYKPREPHKIIIAREPFVAGQPEPIHTVHEFTAKNIKATIDKDGTFIVNQALPAKQLLPQT